MMMTKKDKIKELARRELAKREFWHFCLYMDKTFFKDREDILKTIAYDMQRLIKPIPPQSELDILNVSLPPRAGKSYMTTLFNAWTLGHHPKESIMRNSVTTTLYNKFSKDLKRIMQSKRYLNIFPQIKFDSTSVEQWALETAKQGISYFGGGVEKNITGFGASILSVLDDHIKDEFDALNDYSLDKKWSWYGSVMTAREEKGVKRLFIGTRWSKKDIVGRLITEGFFDGPKSKSIVIPALIDGETFCEAVHTTKYYLDQKKITSDIIWSAEFMQQPIEAKGLVFPKSELNRFKLNVLKSRSYEIEFMLADLADEGDDFLSAGVLARMNNKYYLVDVVYSQDKEEITQPQVADMIDRWNVPTNYIESNAGGKGYKRQLLDMAKTNAYIELFRTVKNKHAKIIMQSGFIRENFYFREDYKPNSDYDKFMRNLTSYNKLGKVNHDDAADMVAMMSEKIRDNATIEFV